MMLSMVGAKCSVLPAACFRVPTASRRPQSQLGQRSVVLRIRPGHTGVQSLAPTLQLAQQIRSLIRKTRSEVVLFSGIKREIVKLHMPVFIKFYQLPVSLANRPAGRATLIAVMGIVPVERIPSERGLTSEQAADINTIAGLRHRPSIDHAEECRHEVGSGYRKIAHASRFRNPGPVGDQGLSNAPL